MNLQDKVNEMLGQVKKEPNTLEKQAMAHSNLMQSQGWQESPSEPIQQPTQPQLPPEPHNVQYDPEPVQQEPEQQVEATAPDIKEELDERERLRAENEAQRRENLKNMRLINERLEWERNEALRLLEQERAAKQKQQEVEVDDSGIDEEDYTSKKHVKKIVNNTLNKTTRTLEEKISQLENKLVEQKLSSQLPGFEKVITDNNLKKLAERFPHHIRNLSYSPNYEDRVKSAYDLITMLGIDKEEDTQRQSDLNRQRIVNNVSRVKAAATVNPNSGSQGLKAQNSFSEELTPERKAQIWREMQEIKRKNPIF